MKKNFLKLNHRSQSLFRILLTMVLLSLFLSPLMAQGGSGYHGRKHKRHHHDAYQEQGDYGRQRYRDDRRWNQGRQMEFRIPNFIRHHQEYKRYFYSTSYHQGHRHNHMIYSFPVLVTGRWIYQPYAYCDGRYFATGYFTDEGPYFSCDSRY